MVREVLLHCVEITSAHAVLRFNCINELYNCYCELDKWTVDSPRRLAVSARHHLMLFVQLHEKTNAADSLLWHLLPKHHLFIHLAEGTRGTNPRHVWNYGFEAGLGECVKLARRSSGKHLQSAIMAKYRILF